MRIIFGIALTLAGLAVFPLEIMRALRRGARGEARWHGATATAFFPTVLAILVVHQKFGPLPAVPVAGVFYYVMLYCMLKAQRLRLGSASAFRISMAVLAAGFAINTGVIIYLALAWEPRPLSVLMGALAATVALATALVELVREERLAKRKTDAE